MTPEAYIRRETGVSALVNRMLNLGIFILVFGVSGPVPVWGIGAYVFDFVPQGFMIGLMVSLVPGVLANKALRAGTVPTLATPSALPSGLIARSLLLAVCCALAGAVIASGVLAGLGLAHLPWGTALAIKLFWAVMLAMIVTPIGLRAALAR